MLNYKIFIYQIYKLTVNIYSLWFPNTLYSASIQLEKLGNKQNITEIRLLKALSLQKINVALATPTVVPRY